MSDGLHERAPLCENCAVIARQVAATCVAAMTVAATGCGSGSSPGLTGSAPSCGRYRNDVTLRIRSQTIKAEKVVKPADRTRGLGGRPCIGANQGMLWAYALPVHISYWMKDMRFPIDIVWIGPDHRVVWLERNLSPSTYPRAFTNEGAGALYVLELKAGRATSLGLRLGSRVAFR
jgi:uncharacterized membrane protein (UPF0127 family)